MNILISTIHTNIFRGAVRNSENHINHSRLQKATSLPTCLLHSSGSFFLSKLFASNDVKIKDILSLQLTLTSFQMETATNKCVGKSML